MSIDHRTVDDVQMTRSRLALNLSFCLAAVAFVASVLTFFGDFLVGPAVMNGSARGTSLVMFAVAVPALVLSGSRAVGGSTRALFVWAGMSMFLTYNSFMLLAGTPINRLFLLYVASFGLAIASMIAIPRSIDTDEVIDRIDSSLPSRSIAGYLGAIVVLNALAWLARIVPATVNDRMPELTAGMGISTVPTYLQDLAFWLPLIGLGAWLLWRRHRWGYLISGAALAFWVLEAVAVAVDQWFGHLADPLSNVASDAVVIPFLVMALLGAVALGTFLRHVSEQAAAEG